MKIDLFWDNVRILNIEKIDNMYISSLYKENLSLARCSGLPIFFLKEINLVSEELPVIIRKRLSNINNLRGKLKFKNDPTEEDIQNSIYDYVNQTGCIRPTDKFSIKIEIK